MGFEITIPPDAIRYRITETSVSVATPVHHGAMGRCSERALERWHCSARSQHRPQ